MPTRYEKLEQEIEILRLRISQLEFRLEHMNDPKPRAHRAHKRDYDTWNSVTTMFRAGMSRTNICKMFHISYNLCKAYLAMPEEEARALPKKKEVSRIIFKAKLEKQKGK